MPLADVAALTQPPHAVVAIVKPQSWTTVVVRPGDTLWDLAIAHHTTVSALVEKNRLTGGGAMIQIGQRLQVPGPPAAAPAPSKPATRPATRPAARPAAPKVTRPKPAPPKPAVAGRVHIVKAGDTMYDIALQYHVSLAKLVAANKLGNAQLIFVGQRIIVPAPPAPPAPSATPPAGYKPSAKMLKAIAASKAKLAAEAVPTRAKTADMIRATATRHGVDPKLALAIGWLESGWFQRAVSYTDAVGVMQIMPTSIVWASELAGRTLDRYDTQDNITAGVLILRALQATAHDQDEAIAGYYQGLRSVQTKGMYDDTKKYVAAILAIYAKL